MQIPAQQTNLFQISWHLTETWETIPDLSDYDIPDLGLAHSTAICGCHFLSKQPFRQGSKVCGEELQRIVGRSCSNKG